MKKIIKLMKITGGAVIVYLLVFVLVTCLIRVDRVCANAYGMEGMLVPDIIINEDGEKTLKTGTKIL